MQMTDGHGERIGGIVWRWWRVESEEQFHHLAHLVLLGAAVAHDGALDLGWRVLDDRASCFDRGEHGHTARVPEFQRASHVVGVKQVFDGDAVRAPPREKLGELPVNPGETLRKGVAGERREGAAGDELMAPTVGLHATVAGALGAGVDAKDPHASDASISFSSMSKFAHTFCTSS